jgi:hypothetical protein
MSEPVELPRRGVGAEHHQDGVTGGHVDQREGQQGHAQEDEKRVQQALGYVPGHDDQLVCGAEPFGWRLAP